MQTKQGDGAENSLKTDSECGESRSNHSSIHEDAVAEPTFVPREPVEGQKSDGPLVLKRRMTLNKSQI